MTDWRMSALAAERWRSGLAPLLGVLVGASFYYLFQLLPELRGELAKDYRLRETQNGVAFYARKVD